MIGSAIPDVLAAAPLPPTSSGEEGDADVFASILGEAHAAQSGDVSAEGEGAPGELAPSFDDQSSDDASDADQGSVLPADAPVPEAQPVVPLEAPLVGEPALPEQGVLIEAAGSDTPRPAGIAPVQSAAPPTSSSPLVGAAAEPQRDVTAGAAEQGGEAIETARSSQPPVSAPAASTTPKAAFGEAVESQQTPDPVGSRAPAVTSPVTAGGASELTGERPVEPRHAENAPATAAAVPAPRGEATPAPASQSTFAGHAATAAPAVAPTDSSAPESGRPADPVSDAKTPTSGQPATPVATASGEGSSAGSGGEGRSDQSFRESAFLSDSQAATTEDPTQESTLPPARDLAGARDAAPATNPQADPTLGSASIAAVRAEPAPVEAAQPTVTHAPVRPTPTTATLDEILAQVRLQAGRGSNRIEVAVDPPELGPVAIRLILRGDRLVGDIAAESREVAKLLESGLDRLRVTMKEVGVHVDSFEVRTTTDEGPGHEPRPGWNERDTEARERGYRKTRDALMESHDEESTSQPGVPVNDGLVDVVV